MGKLRNKFLVILILQIISIESSPYFKMTKIECRDVNKELCRLNACRLKAIKRDITEATIRLQLLKTVYNCQLHVELMKKYNTYQPFFINVTFDACAFMKSRKNATYFDIIFKLIEKYTNINHTCPYEDEFIIERFRPLHSNLILPLPTGQYRILFSFYTSGALLGNLYVWFDFKELEKWESSHKKLGTSKNIRVL